MFSYYGAKTKLAHLYPRPHYDTIIEPFAGSARYALQWYNHRVILFDANPLIVKIWHYLQQASIADILTLPDVPSKQSIADVKGLTDTEKALIGFHLCRGKAKPRHTGHGQNSWARDKQRIANNLHKIKHWTVLHATYRDIDIKLRTIHKTPATWFVDPPYQQTQVRSNSDRYPYGDDIDYNHLASWIKNRSGQVIVCEGGKADWLPFKILTYANTNSNNRTAKVSRELIYHRSQRLF